MKNYENRYLNIFPKVCRNFIEDLRFQKVILYHLQKIFIRFNYADIVNSIAVSESRPIKPTKINQINIIYAQLDMHFPINKYFDKHLANKIHRQLNSQ